jgi:hypothetical protein
VELNAQEKTNLSARTEITGCGLSYGDLNAMLTRYDPQELSFSLNQVEGIKILFISNPGQGL